MLREQRVDCSGLAKSLADIPSKGIDDVEGNILFNLVRIDRFEIDGPPVRVHCQNGERSLQPDNPNSLALVGVLHNPSVALLAEPRVNWPSEMDELLSTRQLRSFAAVDAHWRLSYGQVTGIWYISSRWGLLHPPLVLCPEPYCSTGLASAAGVSLPFIALAISFVVLKPSTVGTIFTVPPHDRTSRAPTTVSSL